MRAFLSKALIVWLVVAAGCHLPWTNRLTLPDSNTVVRDQLTFHCDFALPAHHRLLDELVALRTDICHGLKLPASDETIHVYLFENQDRFNGFMKIFYPDFPKRRSFFIETDTKLSVYAQWGDRIAEDLRHEVTHGYIHSVVPNLPLWLDEGLAEFYEAPRNEQGLNRADLNLIGQRLLNEHWQPDLKRLELLDPTKDMSQNDYAEAWAWVHFLLQPKSKYADVLPNYIADLRRDGVTTSLYERIMATIPDANYAMAEHIRNLMSEKR
jgi:hypothetical protein